jgi:hypothetical protein
MRHRKKRNYMEEFIGDLRERTSPKSSPRRRGEPTTEDLVRYFARRLELIRGTL